MNQKFMSAMCLSLVLGIAGCTPEVGSAGWCEDMKEKAKGDWTANEALEYSKSCLFKSESEE
ncbi:MAG: DUF3012 domain-containing protein [Pseudomonadales bacterium]|uniref:DUF3012 domain-containing protein n=1 Tax=Oleiphilus messinensis TaxID=141451 RepID=A0A1Y0IG32_9GAMM|nr:DUF3012 domain-containing protein [Oleiphilus messinensis]ARU59089.1 hypothetical protein OLMES_5105 [Oleiphilus messinensis]MCG8609528.1 DUF3012 domain-containing protein [Pseudomonadales bacterium]